MYRFVVKIGKKIQKHGCPGEVVSSNKLENSHNTHINNILRIIVTVLLLTTSPKGAALYNT